MPSSPPPPHNRPIFFLLYRHLTVTRYRRAAWALVLRGIPLDVAHRVEELAERAERARTAVELLVDLHPYRVRKRSSLIKKLFTSLVKRGRVLSFQPGRTP